MGHDDDVKPILIPMPVLPTSSTSSTSSGANGPAKKKAVKKKAVKRRAVAGGLEAEIRELAKSSKIEAIKVYRERTGVGLREAKEAVEAIMEG